MPASSTVQPFRTEPGLITEQRPSRRYYRLTRVGEGAMDEVVDRFPALVRAFAGEPETA